MDPCRFNSRNSRVWIGFTFAVIAFQAIAQNNIDDSVNVKATVTGQLKTRHHIITIYAGPTGPLYTVTDEKGIIQGVKMPPALLAARFPVLKSIVDNPADDAGLHQGFPDKQKLEPAFDNN